MEHLYRIAKSKIGSRLVGLVFSHGSNLLPVERLIETENLIAFYHPKPSHPIHILLVPKMVIRELVDLNDKHDEFILDLIRTVQILVERLSLKDSGYRLILNGGEYQEVPQLHFHLVSGESGPLVDDQG